MNSRTLLPLPPPLDVEWEGVRLRDFDTPDDSPTQISPTRGQSDSMQMSRREVELGVLLATIDTMGLEECNRVNAAVTFRLGEIAAAINRSRTAVGGVGPASDQRPSSPVLMRIDSDVTRDAGFGDAPARPPGCPPGRRSPGASRSPFDRPSPVDRRPPLGRRSSDGLSFGGPAFDRTPVPTPVVDDDASTIPFGADDGDRPLDVNHSAGDD